MSEYVYGGLSNVRYVGEAYDLGWGITLRGTYAHLMSPNIMAFARPTSSGPHPGPWRAAKGGAGCDIEVELCVPRNAKLPGGLGAEDAVWWITAVLRLQWPYARASVISDQPFDEAAHSAAEPDLRPLETTPRLFSGTDEIYPILGGNELKWVSAAWGLSADLMQNNPKFGAAFKAFDASTVRGRTSASLLAVWGGLEQLFCPSGQELRFRVSANIAAYLEPPGDARLKLFKDMMAVYNERSSAAHRAADPEQGALVHSYVVMRNALVKMISAHEVPTQETFERLLFCQAAEADA